MNGSFATVINCMDGRVQEVARAWITSNAHVDYVDAITVPGADGALVSGNIATIERLKMMCDISVNQHKSKFVAIVGHPDCAGHPVEKEQHLADIKSAVEIVKSWNADITVVGLWVEDNWLVEKII